MFILERWMILALKLTVCIFKTHGTVTCVVGDSLFQQNTDYRLLSSVKQLVLLFTVTTLKAQSIVE